MKLDVPLIQQRKGSVDCGLACIAMVLNYYDIKTTIKELRKVIELHSFGTYATQLGRYLINQGFEVTVTTLNPSFFTLKDIGLSQDKALENLTNLRKKADRKIRKNNLDEFINFLKAGGKLEVKIPSFVDLKEEIDNRRPCIAILTTRFLWSKEPYLNHHYNVIIGYDRDNIYVNDPSPGVKDGEGRKYNACDFMFGLHSVCAGDISNGSIIKIRKK